MSTALSTGAVDVTVTTDVDLGTPEPTLELFVTNDQGTPDPSDDTVEPAPGVVIPVAATPEALRWVFSLNIATANRY